MPIPIIVFGDGPTTQSGLGRIATDLARQLHADRERLGIDVYQVGWVKAGPPEGLPDDATFNGWAIPGFDWPVWGFKDLRGWGRNALMTAYKWWLGLDRRAIILTCWDPGRCYDLLARVPDVVYPTPPAEYWGYFAIDAVNANGGISGPAAHAIQQYDQVLAYTAFGDRALQALRQEKVEHLPHGIDCTVFRPDAPATQWSAILKQRAMGAPIIGCVAANTARKDFGTFFLTLREMERRYAVRAHAWIHTDELVTQAWSIPQLAEDFEMRERLTVTQRLSDADLASLYTACTATFAPGKGEGFGYPIVESLACGVPVAHVAYGGGEEFTPTYWRIPYSASHLVGPYALRRPILDPRSVASSLMQQILTPETPDRWRALVTDLDWPTLWPSWRDWFAQRLVTFGGSQ